MTPAAKHIPTALAGLLIGLAAHPTVLLAQEEAAKLVPEDDFYTAMVKMLAGLALVLGILFAVYWLARRLMPGQAGAGGARMRVLGRLGLGPRKFLALVEVADRVLLLGVSGDGIRLLLKLEDPEDTAKLTQGGGGFAQVLKRASRSKEDQES